MLGLAITLGVRQWVEPALQQLFYIQMYSLSTSERDEIGSDAFAVISNAQLLLSDQSLMHNSYSQTNVCLVPVCPPPMANVGFGMKGCRYYGILHEKSRCARAWDHGWKEIGLRFIHPEEPVHLSQAMWYIQGHPFNGVSEECRIATIESLPPFFEIETQIYQRAVKRLVNLSACPLIQYKSQTGASNSDHCIREGVLCLPSPSFLPSLKCVHTASSLFNTPFASIGRIYYIT
ncbi:hypothetical protein BDP27DRAFT_1427236 [Rhodocollybia butyracea]|uniref:Uncharacterized protein n=1 Tax=Rhodocollybia butyracea TaxID=206335 RepID=A0A9P5PCL5_9AGAR|nr:hypothetical protein BDP27DRAFT_1427236 [Rhodocollybia butyracea]